MLWATAKDAATNIQYPYGDGTIRSLEEPLTNRLILKQFYVKNTTDVNWTGSIAFVKFQLKIGHTPVLDETISESDTNRDNFHIYDMGTVSIPVIAEKEALMSLVITTDPALNPDSIRFIWGLRGRWLMDNI